MLLLAVRLAGFFGALALLLSALGLYGVLSYGVVRRKHEIGVRMALGTQPGHVVGMVLREAATLVVVGAAIGIPATLAGGRLVADQLFGVPVADLWTMMAAMGFLLTVAEVAAYLPARRAARLDPTAAI